jgi:hypothetical protein
MKPCQAKPFILFAMITLMVFSCSNSDSEKTENIQTGAPQLVGTWQQTAIGKEKVSDFVVKIIFSDRTLTMDAPGCVIIGDYTTDGNILSYTVTAVQGERCSKQQVIGQSDSVYYVVTDAQLTMTPLSAGKESQVVYKRIADNTSHP